MLYNELTMQHRDFLTIPQFADEIGLSRSQVFRIVKAGKIQAEKFGRVYLIPSEELHRLTGEKSAADQRLIGLGVKKVIKEYGEVIRDLGDK